MTTGNVSKLARMGYSAVAFAVGVGSYALVAEVASHPPTPKEFLIGFFWWFYAGVIFAILGWIFALPLILLISRVDGWRFWAFLAVGMALGPAALIGLQLCTWIASGKGGWLHSFGSLFLLLGATVATVTTLTYLLLVRRAQGRMTKV